MRGCLSVNRAKLGLLEVLELAANRVGRYRVGSASRLNTTAKNGTAC